MRSRITILAALALATTSSLMLTGVSSLAKPRVQDFIIAGHDGYGTQECLVSHSSCGRIVADAWCEAKGFKNAQSYRAASPDDVTGAISAAPAKGPEAFVITCRD
jgi:hypothetical protein